MVHGLKSVCTSEDDVTESIVFFEERQPSSLGLGESRVEILVILEDRNERRKPLIICPYLWQRVIR